MKLPFKDEAFQFFILIAFLSVLWTGESVYKAYLESLRPPVPAAERAVLECIKKAWGNDARVACMKAAHE